MLLFTRFWSLILVIGAVAGIAIAMIGTHVINEQNEISTHESLVRDRFVLEELLKLDARARIDAIAPIAAHNDIRTALRTASGRQAGAQIDEALATTLRTRLGELNVQLGEMAGDLVFAVDADGIIVAQVGGQAPPHGAGLGAFPLVRRALDGYVRDDVWIYNDDVYRMAARPVVEGGQYVGAIVHGKRIDDAFATRLVGFLSGASLGFFRREQIIASAMPAEVPGAPRRDDLQAPLAQVEQTPEFQAGQLTDPQSLATGGQAIYHTIVGAASHGTVGYALGRPQEVLASPTAILDHASGDDWAGLPWPALGGAAFVLFLISLLSSFLEHDRPLAKFRDAADKLAKRDLDRFVPPEFGGALRTAAARVNDALDKVQDAAAAGSGGRRKAADLDSILGKAPEASSPAFFAFGGDDGKDKSKNDFDLPPVPPAGAAAPPAPKPAPPAPAPAAPKPPEAAPPAPPAPPAPKPPAPPGPPPAAPKPPGPPIKPSDALTSTLIGVAPAASIESAGPVQAQAVKRPAPADEPPPEDEDGATMVAKVPDELLKRAGSEEAEQEAHFREVFEQFLATKKQCNEPVAGLTYDKFVVTLRKNKEQIVSKHGAAKVRFTVYVKEGKAALKATPIKE
jgi:hypothetical protein